MKKINAAFENIIRSDWWLPLILTLAFVICAVGIGSYSNHVIPLNRDLNARYLSEPGTHLDFMSNWDGPHYLHIAKDGYTDSALTAFFPLYPLLIHLLSIIFHSGLISALLISWGCLFGALCFYLRIIRATVGDDRITIIRGLLLFLFFPTGIFLAATYTEALFALLALSAVYFAMKKRFLLAAVSAGLVSAAHPEGIFITVLIALILWEVRTSIWRIVVSVCIGASGLIGYMIYLKVAKNNALAFIDAQKGSGWLGSHYFSTLYNSLTAIDIICLALVIMAVIYWRKKRLSFALYSLLFALLPFVGGNFAGYSRYCLMAFPVQLMLLARFKNSKLAYPVVLLLSGIIWTFYVIHYAAGYTGG